MTELEAELQAILEPVLMHLPEKWLKRGGQLAVQGIPAADQPHVFDRFYRSRSPSRVAGTGLGLAIVRSIVEAHGGGASVESQEGKGTSVRFTLPLIDQ